MKKRNQTRTKYFQTLGMVHASLLAKLCLAYTYWKCFRIIYHSLWTLIDLLQSL